MTSAMSETTSAKARNRSALLHQRFHAAPSRCAASRITTSAPTARSSRVRGVAYTYARRTPTTRKPWLTTSLATASVTSGSDGGRDGAMSGVATIRPANRSYTAIPRRAVPNFFNIRSTPAVESRATWGSIASLSPSPTRTARRFRSSTSRSRSSRICRNANPPMTISTESQMAPTRRIVSFMTVVAFSPRLEPQVLVRRGVGVVGDERQARLLHAWPVAIDKGELPDRRDHRLLVHELLDPLERRLALLPVHLARLLAEEPVDVRIAAVDVGAASGDERLEAGRRVPEGPGAALDDVPELLLPVLGEEGRALERPELGPDGDRLQVIHNGLREVGVGHVAVVVTGGEAVRVAGLGEELPGPGRIVRVRGRLPEEVEARGDDAVGDLREAQGLGLVDRRPVDRQVDGQAHSPVVPRRLRVPLIDEDEPEGGGRGVGLEREPGRPLALLGLAAADRVDDVGLAAHALGVDHLDGGDALPEGGGGRAAVALEGELDVLGGHGFAGVEPDALAQDELVDEPVGRGAPRLGETGRHRVAGHRLHQRVVERVEHHERRDDPRGLGGVEPRRGEGDVNAPRQLPLGRGAGRRGRAEPHAHEQRHDDGASQPSLEQRRSAHGHSSRVANGRTMPEES